jgi:hypothetical protein
MAKDSGQKPDGYIELSFGPRWKYIAVVRSFIQSFMAVSLQDTTRADNIAMAASELLENAVKYAAGDDIKIAVSVLTTAENISISVSNQASTEAVETLKSLFQKIMKGDPLEAYMSQMREAAVRKDGKSQLGLARIRYETGLDMDVKVHGDSVTVSLESKRA